MTAAAPRSAPPAPTAPSPAPLRTLGFQALGTYCEVRYAAATAAQATAFEQAARDWVEAFEARYSRFRPTSIVSQINAAAGSAWVDIDPEMEQMLDLCGTLHTMTAGILDATAGPLMRLWNYREPPPELPGARRVAEVRTLVGWPLVQRAPGRVFLPRPGMALDFGGFGKEWAVDAVALIAGAHGITQALVDFGHDIRCVGAPAGRPAWHIGLEDPGTPGRHRSSIALFAGKGVASSGDYLRGFTRDGRRYGHIVDPRTGYPVAHGCRQVTVVADTCFQAGILSTTAFVLGPTSGLEFIQRFPGAECMIVTTTGSTHTRGWWTYVVT